MVENFIKKWTEVWTEVNKKWLQKHGLPSVTYLSHYVVKNLSKYRKIPEISHLMYKPLQI